MNRRKSRTYYVGMICTDAYLKATGESAFIGAASGKMGSIVAALRLAGQRAVLVSLPFIGKAGRRQPGRLCWADGFPALFLPVSRSPVVRKVFGPFVLAWFALRRVKPHDTVLFYNHAPEYILALLCLHFRRVSVFHDIEDVPLSSEEGLRGLLNRLSFKIMFAISSQRKVTVSNQVAKRLGITHFFAVQGVATDANLFSNERKWQSLERGAPLRVHYGGSLTVSTGVELFCSTVMLLDKMIVPPGIRIDFIVTGMGEISRIREMGTSIESDWLRMEVHQEIERSTYLGIIDTCHVSMSLKSPESEIACTTFPSKVIEITSRGVALISSPISDISEIFSDDDVWLLPRFNERMLSSILIQMARCPQEVRRRAAAGQLVARDRFGSLEVGRKLARYLS